MKSILPALLLCVAIVGCGGGSSSTPVQPTGPTPSVSVSIAPATVNAGQPATLTWSSANVTDCNIAAPFTEVVPTSGSLSVTVVAPGNTSYSLSCTGSYGPATQSATLTVNTTPSQVTIPLPGPPAACTSNCLYVDANSGSDTNDGLTPATAFQTLQKAADATTPGATVTVMNGTYTSSTGVDMLSITTSGTADAWIRFIAGAGQHPIIQLAADNWAWQGIAVNANYIVVDGFEVIGQNQSLNATKVGAGDPNNGMLNEACIGVGSSTVTPHDVILRNNILHDCTEGGIGVLGADAVTAAYNTIYNNAWWTVYDGSGVSFAGLNDVTGATTTAGYRNWIVGNVVYGNFNYMPDTYSTPPAITDGNAIIIDSTLHAGTVGAIPYMGRTYIANNIVYNNGGRGIHVFSSDHVDVVNNTSYNNMLSPSTWIVFAEIDAYDSYDVNVVNNVAMNLNGKQVDENDNNAYWYNLWSGTNVPYLGTDDLEGNPQFTDAAADNFIPKAGSPALGSGTATLAPTIDFAGFSRPAATIDRGAYQVTH